MEKKSHLLYLREQIRFKNPKENPPQLPLSPISSKSKLCFYMFIYVVIIRNWYIYQC